MEPANRNEYVTGPDRYPDRGNENDDDRDDLISKPLTIPVIRAASTSNHFKPTPKHAQTRTDTYKYAQPRTHKRCSLDHRRSDASVNAYLTWRRGQMIRRIACETCSDVDEWTNGSRKCSGCRRVVVRIVDKREYVQTSAFATGNEHKRRHEENRRSVATFGGGGGAGGRGGRGCGGCGSGGSGGDCGRGRGGVCGGDRVCRVRLLRNRARPHAI
ncbi:hypothetical protein QTP88_002324 [Uroleucon formosanum]